MSKLYIIQSYNTTENDLYALDPDYIENIITNSKKEAEMILDYINDYNEVTTGVNDLINSAARIVEIDLGNTVIDPSIKFETLASVIETHQITEEE